MCWHSKPLSARGAILLVAVCVSAGDGLQVTFPACALVHGGQATIGRVTEMPRAVFGFFDHVGTFEVSLKGRTEFDDDVVLERPLDPAMLDPPLAPEEKITAARWDAERALWIELSTTVDRQRGVIVARTRHLSNITFLVERHWRWVARRGMPAFFLLECLHSASGPQRDAIKQLSGYVVLVTDNFRILYKPSNLSQDTHIAGWKGETVDNVDEEYREWWKLQHAQVIPFIRDVAYCLEKSLAAYRGQSLEPIYRAKRPHPAATLEETVKVLAGIRETTTFEKRLLESAMENAAARAEANIQSEKARLAAYEARLEAAKSRNYCDLPDCHTCRLRKACEVCRSTPSVCPDCAARSPAGLLPPVTSDVRRELLVPISDD